MKTDKQVYALFAANPRWLFELTGLPWPGPCQWKSESFKELEQSSDGIIAPQDIDQPLIVVEVQAQYDKFIYSRIVLEMAMLQRQAGNRAIQGILLFFEESLDPKVQPWHSIIEVFYLAEILEELSQQQPEHPLVAVFRPVLQDDSEILGKQAAKYYNQIKCSNLPSAQIETLLKVFTDWLCQRFYFCNPKEIEEMLVGALPELRETQSGKDLIAIGKLEGKLEGKAEGKADSLLLLVEAKFGPQSEELRQRILSLKSIEHINHLLVQAVHVDAIEQLNW